MKFLKTKAFTLFLEIVITIIEEAVAAKRKPIENATMGANEVIFTISATTFTCFCVLLYSSISSSNHAIGKIVGSTFLTNLF